MTEMPDFIEDINEVEMDDETKPWEIKDDGSAEWAVEQIRKAELEQEKWKKFYADQFAKVEKSTNDTIDYFTAKLHQYFNGLLHHVTKTQETYELPNGKLVLKKQSPDYKRDDAKLILWAAESGKDELIKTVTKQTFDWASAKKEMTGYEVLDGHPVDPFSGEIIEGLTIEAREPKFVIE